jgi:hypothetical protein
VVYEQFTTTKKEVLKESGIESEKTFFRSKSEFEQSVFLCSERRLKVIERIKEEKRKKG